MTTPPASHHPNSAMPDLPLTVFSILSDVETPISLYAKVSAGESISFLLESVDMDSRLARFSFMGIAPSQTFHFKNGVGVLEHHLTDAPVQTFPLSHQGNNPLDVLKNSLADVSRRFTSVQMDDTLVPFPFTGGWVGYMGYGASRYFENIPQQACDPLEVPEGYYGLYESILIFDHLTRRISFLSYRPPSEALALWKQLQQKMTQACPLSVMAVPELSPEASRIQEAKMEAAIDDLVGGAEKEQSFCQMVETCKAFIEEGQVFQIVAAHRFEMPAKASAISIYRMLQATNPSPYSYFLQFPGFAYLGSSPETFVRCHQGEVILRALAGTRPRGADPSQDLALAQELKADEKELAEHHMLVDLGRNDLGRVCQPGSIKVGDIAQLQRYTHVMHLATELTGKLQTNKDIFQVFQGCFPRGTVSGAPKIRAMQLLSELEPEQRGIYAGVVGYFDFLGNMDAAIAIRSALVKDGKVHVQAGAGVVYDSVPALEYLETRNKARSILKAAYLAEKQCTEALETQEGGLV
ncbi:MAG: anthranilate synthase component I family protein [Cyanobacteria bacterium]|nr:anthranilate synthase component I family protein [Cyanobacteriota bacterium]